MWTCVCEYMNVFEKRAVWDRCEKMRDCSLLIVTLDTSEILQQQSVFRAESIDKPNCSVQFPRIVL